MDDFVKEKFINFGLKIKKLREERNMSIEELSMITGIRLQYLKKIEAGTAHRLTSTHVLIFSNVFNIKPNEVVSDI